MKTQVKNIVITALMIAFGFLLPPLFHMVAAGPVMLPMHIPVLITGLACGPVFGALCGLILPLLSSVLTGMPPLFPTAISMTLELCAYGVCTGLFYRKLSWNIYPAMLLSMLSGRLVSGMANAILLGMAARPYGMQAFLTASFVTGLPGIVIQLVFVPAIVAALTKARLIEKPAVRAVV